MLDADGTHGGIVDGFVVGVILGVVKGVVDDFEESSREVEFHPVREVAAIFENEAGEEVAGFEQGLHDGLIGLCAAVGLHVGETCTKEFFGAIAGDGFDLIVIDAATVVTSTWVPLSVLVGQAGSHGVHHGRGDMVLAGDEFDGGHLTLSFMCNQCRDVGIGLAEELEGGF